MSCRFAHSEEECVVWNVGKGLYGENVHFRLRKTFVLCSHTKLCVVLYRNIPSNLLEVCEGLSRKDEEIAEGCLHC